MKSPRIPYPAAETGVAHYVTPYSGFVLITEKVSVEKGSYEVLDPSQNNIYTGIDADKYPTLYLVSQKSTEDGKWIIRYWASDRDAAIQNLWNYRLEFEGDNSGYPQYLRELYIPRDQYSPATTFSSAASGSLLSIKVTNQGSGYTYATASITGITGATAVCNVQNGKIISVVLTNPGSGGSSPLVTINGDGSGATAVAVMPIFSGELVKEIRADLPDEDSLRGRYVKVSQVYMTLPGPWVERKTFDDDGQILTTKYRVNKPANITPAESLVTGIWTRTTKEPLGESSILAKEVVETRSIPGNWIVKTMPAEDGAVLTISRCLAAISTITSGETAGGTWDVTTKEPYQGSALVAWEVVTSRPLPGNWLNKKSWEEDGMLMTRERRLNNVSSISPVEGISGGTWTVITQEPHPDSALVAWEIEETREIPGGTLVEFQIDTQTGIVVEVHKTLVAATEAIAANAGKSGGWFVEFKSVNAIVSLKIQSQIVGSRLPYTSSSPLVYAGTENISLPDVLTSLSMLWDDHYSSSTAFDDNSADANAAQVTEGTPIIKLLEGYRGPAKANFTRYYTLTPPSLSSVTAPTVIKPVHGTLRITTKSKRQNLRLSSNGAAAGGEAILSVRSHTIGPFLTNSVSLTNTSHSPGTTTAVAGSSGPYVATAQAISSGTASWEVDASTPAVINSGDVLLKYFQVEQWRLDLFVVTKCEVIVP